MRIRQIEGRELGAPRGCSFWLLVGVIWLFGGCSTLNEGQIDYRFVPLQTTASGDEPSGLKDKYVRPGDATLLHRGDTISVHLLQGFIKDFSEATDRALKVLTFGRVKVRGDRHRREGVRGRQWTVG